MSDQPEPRRVLQRFNERIGKTRDPFARHQLEGMRDNLQETVEKAREMNKQLEILEEGHKSLQTDHAAEVVNEVERRTEAARQEAVQQAALLDTILDHAEEQGSDFDLSAFLAEVQQAKAQAAAQRAQAAGGPAGPGPGV